jgi:tetratricopeptide (TPR) repeat protein
VDLRRWGGSIVSLTLVAGVALLALAKEVLGVLAVPGAVLAALGVAVASVAAVSAVVAWRNANRSRTDEIGKVVQLMAKDRLPRVREVDPYTIGVQWSDLVRRFGYGRGASRCLPAYVQRSPRTEETLQTALAERRPFVLVTGPSSAGKSRLAFEAARRVWPDSELVVPSEPDRLVPLLEFQPAITVRSDPAILWLDDVERYLRAGLTLARLRRFRARLGRRALILLATIRAAERSLLVGDAAVRREAQEVLRVAEDATIVLETNDPVDDTAAEQAYPGVDFRGGIGLYFTGTKELEERYRTSDELVVSLVRAAVDWRRAGFQRSIPSKSLWRVARLERERFATHEAELEACGRATEPVSSGLRLLSYIASEDAFVVADPLLDLDDAGGRPIPEAAWRELISEASPAEAVAISESAIEREVLAAARSAAEKALGADLGGISTHARFLLGVIARRQGDGEAERWLAEAAAAGHPRAGLELGRCFEGRGDVGGAERWYQRARESGDPGATAEASLALGDLAAAQGASGEALLAWKLALHPADPVATPAAALRIGKVRAEEGDLAGAQVAWEQALAYPHAEATPEAALRLGELYERNGRTADAESAWTLAREAATGDTAVRADLALGAMYRRLRRVEDALEVLRAAATRGSVEAFAALASLYTELQRWPRALQAADALAARDPSNIEGNHARVMALAALGRADEAWRIAVSMTTDAHSSPLSWDALAQAALARGFSEQARAAALRCRDLAPASALGHIALCRVAEAEQRWEELAEEATAALDLAVSADALRFAGRATLELRTYWDAVDAYGEILRRNPDDRAAREGAGEAARRLGTVTPGEAWWRILLSIANPLAILGGTIFAIRKYWQRRQLPREIRALLGEARRRRRARSWVAPAIAAVFLALGARGLAGGVIDGDGGSIVQGAVGIGLALALLARWLYARHLLHAERL